MGRCFFVKKVDNSSTQGALCTVSVFFILHFTYLGGAYAPNAPPSPYEACRRVLKPAVISRSSVSQNNAEQLISGRRRRRRSLTVSNNRTCRVHNAATTHCKRHSAVTGGCKQQNIQRPKFITSQLTFGNSLSPPTPVDY